jgi:hypothetical protein
MIVILVERKMNSKFLDCIKRGWSFGYYTALDPIEIMLSPGYFCTYNHVEGC